MAQFSHLYITAGETIALTIWAFISKGMFLIFDMLSNEEASFYFKAAIIVCSDFRAQENKICHHFHFSPSIYPEVMRPDAILLVF